MKNKEIVKLIEAANYYAEALVDDDRVMDAPDKSKWIDSDDLIERLHQTIEDTAYAFVDFAVTAEDFLDDLFEWGDSDRNIIMGLIEQLVTIELGLKYNADTNYWTPITERVIDLSGKKSVDTTDAYQKDDIEFDDFMEAFSGVMRTIIKSFGLDATKDGLYGLSVESEELIDKIKTAYMVSLENVTGKKVVG